MAWTSPAIIGALIFGISMLAAFIITENRTDEPMFQLALFRIPAFAAGSTARFAAAVAQGGLQFMLVIWLQGIWLPLHGFDYADTPLRCGICMLPLTGGFLLAGPLSGFLSDRLGSRGLAAGGMLLFAGALIGMTLLPINFSYGLFAALITTSGIGVGMFSAPNTSSIMGSVPVERRGAASGMRSTFQNGGMLLSIGLFFSLMIAGLADNLPTTLARGLQQQGVAAVVAHRIAVLPPVSSLFSAFLGVNPMQHLLTPDGVLAALPAGNQRALTGREFFPHLISGPFQNGLRLAFGAAAGLSLLAAAVSFINRSPTNRVNGIGNENNQADDTTNADEISKAKRAGSVNEKLTSTP
jgi:MFS family permease